MEEKEFTPSPIMYKGTIPMSLYRRGRQISWTKVTIDKLAYKSPTTDTYVPLMHMAVINMLYGALQDNGQTIEAIRLNLGTGLKSGMVVRILTRNADDDIKNMWTLVHGHNRRSSIKVASGFEVVVCTNGCFFATEILSCMHTKNVEETFKARLHEFVAKEVDQLDHRTEVINHFKETPITLPRAKEVILTAALDGIITNPVRVARTFINHGIYTVWELWQAITYHEDICGEKPLLRAGDQYCLLERLASDATEQ